MLQPERAKSGTMRDTNLVRWALAVEAERTREEDGHEQRRDAGAD